MDMPFEHLGRVQSGPVVPLLILECSKIGWRAVWIFGAEKCYRLLAEIENCLKLAAIPSATFAKSGP
jgi:hypothetical protein